MPNWRLPYCVLSVLRAGWPRPPGVLPVMLSRARLHHCRAGGAEVSGSRMWLGPGVRSPQSPAFTFRPLLAKGLCQGGGGRLRGLREGQRQGPMRLAGFSRRLVRVLGPSGTVWAVIENRWPVQCVPVPVAVCLVAFSGGSCAVSAGSCGLAGMVTPLLGFAVVSAFSGVRDTVCCVHCVMFVCKIRYFPGSQQSLCFY